MVSVIADESVRHWPGAVRDTTGCNRASELTWKLYVIDALWHVTHSPSRLDIELELRIRRPQRWYLTEYVCNLTRELYGNWSATGVVSRIPVHLCQRQNFTKQLWRRCISNVVSDL